MTGGSYLKVLNGENAWKYRKYLRGTHLFPLALHTPNLLKDYHKQVDIIGCTVVPYFFSLYLLHQVQLDDLFPVAYPFLY